MTIRTTRPVVLAIGLACGLVASNAAALVDWPDAFWVDTTANRGWQIVPDGCGTQQFSNTAPLSIAGCVPVGGCAGTGGQYADGTITLNAASVEQASQGWVYPGWNHCGSGFAFSQRASFHHFDLVISGPTPSVLVRYQFDYDFVMEMVNDAPDSANWGGMLKLGILLPWFGIADSYVAVGWIPPSTTITVENPLGGSVEQIGPWKWRFSGRWISPEISLPTGTPNLGFNFVVAASSFQGVNSAYVQSQFLTTSVSLPIGEPVFILPDGFTANSATMGLVDNIIISGGAPCPSDFTGDGVVDGADLGVLLSVWGSSDAGADLNGDGVIDGADLGILLSAWGACGE